MINDQEGEGPNKRRLSFRTKSAEGTRQSSGNRIKDEIKAKMEKRVTIEGFVGNSTKETRESAINTFLEGLGKMANYGKYSVFAKGATGSAAIIEFKDKETAAQFITDNLTEIKEFKTVDNKGATRDTYFNRYKDDMEWKIYHATRLLTNKIVESKEMEPLTVKAFKHRGVISIDGFDIIKIKEGEDEAIEYKMLKQNLKDLDAENAESKLKAIIDTFAAKFH